MLAVAVMSKLSGDSEENVTEIANANGIRPLVALLDADDAETQAHAAVVLEDMTRISQQHATTVAKEGGIPLLVALLTTGSDADCRAEAAGALGSLSMGHAREVSDAGAISPLVALLAETNPSAQLKAAGAIACIAAGGHENQDAVHAAGGVELLVGLLDETQASMDATKRVNSADIEPGTAATSHLRELHLREKVQSQLARALSELCHGHTGCQGAIASCGGIKPLIELVECADSEHPKEEAAGVLWRLAVAHPNAKSAIADQGGIRVLVDFVSKASERGQKMAAGALAALVKGNKAYTATVAELMTGLLRNAHESTKARGEGQDDANVEVTGSMVKASVRADDSSMPEQLSSCFAMLEKAARAISRFARAHADNQDAVMAAGCFELLATWLGPRWYALPPAAPNPVGMSYEFSGAADCAAINLDGTRQRNLAQKELAGALWSTAIDNAAILKSSAAKGGIPRLIRMLSEHPEVHRDAAGALWALSADRKNQHLIAEADGLSPLVELLKNGKKNAAQETAAGALHALAQRADNRTAIGETGAIGLLSKLFEDGSAEAKVETAGALLTLSVDNLSNQFKITSKLVALLAAGPDDASEASTNLVGIARVEACEHATRVLYTMSLERDNREALSSAGSITQLVRQLKGGSETAQTMAASALPQIARMSPELRIQVVQQLVNLLSSDQEDVRRRAGNTLRDMTVRQGGDPSSDAHQRAAAMAGGVAPLVALLKDGLNDGRVEAQEYSLWSLSMTSDAGRRATMVAAGVVAPLVQALTNGQLSVVAQAHAATVISFLAIDKSNHIEIISRRGVPPLVLLLEEGTLNAKRHAAVGLARLSRDNPNAQSLIYNAGAVTPLVRWLGDPSIGPPEIAANALSDLAYGNADMQTKIEQANAIPPLVAMLDLHAGLDYQRAASDALATLAQENSRCQRAIAAAGGIPPCVDLLKSGKGAHKDVANALAMLAADEENKMQIARVGGIGPLVELLSTGDHATQQHAAKALEWLARDCAENQVALANEKASAPLVSLLGSESAETQESAVTALLCLASHASSRTVVVKRLVAALEDRNTASQLKAAEALAVLSSRSATNRAAIVSAGAIFPLVTLLGNGQMAETKTPPERAAAVLADLARLSESKMAIAEAGGIPPLVSMLSSNSEQSQTHAATALWHLSASVDNKNEITKQDAIPKFVHLLSHGTPMAKHNAAAALYQLATTADNKGAIVQAAGIPALVGLLHEGDNVPEAKEAAAAVLSELARSEKSNRVTIERAGGIAPLVAVMVSGLPMAQRYATCALWGLSQEPLFRTGIAKCTNAVERLVMLLKGEHEVRGLHTTPPSAQHETIPS